MSYLRIEPYCLWIMLFQGDRELQVLRRVNSWHIAVHSTGLEGGRKKGRRGGRRKEEIKKGERKKEGREGGKKSNKARFLALSLIILAIKRTMSLIRCQMRRQGCMLTSAELKVPWKARKNAGLGESETKQSAVQEGRVVFVQCTRDWGFFIIDMSALCGCWGTVESYRILCAWAFSPAADTSLQNSFLGFLCNQIWKSEDLGGDVTLL